VGILFNGAKPMLGVGKTASVLAVLPLEITDIVRCAVEAILSGTDQDVRIAPERRPRYHSHTIASDIEIETPRISERMHGARTARHAEAHEEMIVLIRVDVLRIVRIIDVMHCPGWISPVTKDGHACLLAATCARSIILG
jgi:hypothetical protein